MVESKKAGNMRQLSPKIESEGGPNRDAELKQFQKINWAPLPPPASVGLAYRPLFLTVKKEQKRAGITQVPLATIGGFLVGRHNEMFVLRVPRYSPHGMRARYIVNV